MALLMGASPSPAPAQDWSTPVRISGPGGCEYPQILAIGDTLHVVYTYARDGGRIEYVRSSNGGRGWGQPAMLSDTANSSVTYWARVMANGGWALAVWKASEDAWPYRNNVYCAQSTDGGRSWGPEAALLQPGLVPNFYLDATSSGPLVNAVYGFYEGESGRFQGLRSTDFGETWSSPSEVFPFYNAGAISMASFGETVHLAWGGRFAPTETYEVYHAKSTDGGLTWGPNAMVSEDDGRPSQLPSLALDDSGNVALAWWDMKYSPNYTVGDILVRLSFNAGETWGPEGVATTCHTADFSDVAWDGDTIRITWEDQRAFPEGRMVYYTQSPNLIDWSPELRLDVEPEASFNPALAVWGGRVFAVWGDAICNPDTDICGGLYFSMYPYEPDGVSEDAAEGLPGRASLLAYPNPFNSSTIIYYSFSNVEKGGDLEIFDLRGRVVCSFRTEGSSGIIEWDATDAMENKISSGIYFARASASQEEKTIKLIYLK